MPDFKVAAIVGRHSAALPGAGLVQAAVAGTQPYTAAPLFNASNSLNPVAASASAYYLPDNYVGAFMVCRNAPADTTSAALIFPPLGGSIAQAGGAAAANAVFSLPAYRTAVFYPVDDLTGINWIAVLSS